MSYIYIIFYLAASRNQEIDKLMRRQLFFYSDLEEIYMEYPKGFVIKKNLYEQS